MKTLVSAGEFIQYAKNPVICQHVAIS